MLLKVKSAHYLKDYQVEITFNDGKTAVVDLHDELSGEVFEPLKFLPLFQTVRVDPVMKTLAWDNGADLAPEFLYYKAFRNDANLQATFHAWGYC